MTMGTAPIKVLHYYYLKGDCCGESDEVGNEGITMAFILDQQRLKLMKNMLLCDFYFIIIASVIFLNVPLWTLFSLHLIYYESIAYKL